MSVRVKMKTLILAISTLFCVAYLHAQTNYYATTKTFNQDGYIYQCHVKDYEYENITTYIVAVSFIS